jgi:hypothetical protein
VKHSNVIVLQSSLSNIISPVNRERPQSYPYFDVVMGLVWSNDPASYSGGSLAITMPDRSKVMSQTKRSTLVLPVGGWAWG